MTVVLIRFLKRPTDGSISSGLIICSSSLKWIPLVRFRFGFISSDMPSIDIRRFCAVLNSVKFYNKIKFLWKFNSIGSIHTSSSRSVSGNPNKLEAWSDSLSNWSIIGRGPKTDVDWGRSRIMYVRVDAPKWNWLFIGNWVGLSASIRILPMYVPWAK